MGHVYKWTLVAEVINVICYNKPNCHFGKQEHLWHFTVQLVPISGPIKPTGRRVKESVISD